MEIIKNTELNTLIKNYLKEVELQHSYETYRSYKYAVPLYYKFLTENLLHGDRIGVLAWLKYLEQVMKLNNSTINSYFIAVRSFYYWCLNNEFIDKNPSANIKLKHVEETEKKYLNNEQLKKLLSANKPPKSLKNDKYYIRNWTLLCVMATSGVRVDSICHLRACDVDFETGTIYLDRAKGGRSYSVVIDNTVLKSVRIYMNEHRPKDLPPDAELFVNEAPEYRLDYLKNNKLKYYKSSDGKYYTRLCASNVSIRICYRYTEIICGIGLYAHSLRHTTANFMLEMGLPAQVIQEQLKHKNIATTMKYLHGLELSTVKNSTQSAWDKLRVDMDSSALCAEM